MRDEDRVRIRHMVDAGEAASRVSPETRVRLSEVPWTEAIVMRNRLIHGYFDVDPGIVWRTVQEEIPPLVRALRTALGAAGD